MKTVRQTLGDFGEKIVAKKIKCQICNHASSKLSRLPSNFKAADLVCDFCGHLSQVKTLSVSNIEVLPKKIIGAAWQPILDRVDANFCPSFFIVLVTKQRRNFSVFRLDGRFIVKDMFEVRKPLTSKAKNPGWQGYLLVTTDNIDKFERII